MAINQTSVWNGSQWVTMGGSVDTASNYNWAGSHNFAQSAIFQDDVRVKSLNGGQLAGFRNKIINGGFDIWQRGTSFTSTGFTADRFMSLTDGTGLTRTVSRQSFTPGNQIAGYEPQYFYRMAQTVAGSGATFSTIFQSVEDVRTFAGQQVTFSFWAKASSNITAGYYSAQNFGSGGSAAVMASPGSYGSQDAVFNVTTSWQRFSATFTMPSILNKTIGTGSYVEISIVTPRNITFTLDVWGLQFEAGPVATPFEQKHIGTELSLCHRYYWKNIVWGTGTRYGGNMYVPVMNRIEMRGTPSISKYSNGDALGIQTISTISVNDNNQYGFNYSFTSAGTDYQATRCLIYLEASAEL